MPIVGVVTSGRDDYLPQLVQSAEAAINYLVDMGISERENISVMGRSYGAFAVANLMAHTKLFKTGIAMSGAYNRTLTPFGFQKQTRTFWQNTEAYVNLSPFFFANKISGSLLLLHGQDDDNPGTPAFQSERFYAALAGNGVKSRYVSFPHEGHQFRGRRTVLHASAEMINWLDRHMKPSDEAAVPN
jgi:dipeptidyl aminopeptidase/acylaminoacyl peptidase